MKQHVAVGNPDSRLAQLETRIEDLGREIDELKSALTVVERLAISNPARTARPSRSAKPE